MNNGAQASLGINEIYNKIWMYYYLENTPSWQRGGWPWKSWLGLLWGSKSQNDTEKENFDCDFWIEFNI